MKRFEWVLMSALVLAMTGCANDESAPADNAAGTAGGGEQAEIDKAMAGLSEADRKVAIAQAVCPVGGSKLGTMGTPVKVTVKDRDVFLCCKGCTDSLESDPDKYLAKLDAE